jgi:hypothetical protein
LAVKKSKKNVMNGLMRWIKQFHREKNFARRNELMHRYDTLMLELYRKRTKA